MQFKKNNHFSLRYYRDIISEAKKTGYEFCTVSEFYQKGCPNKGHFILRHDIDLAPNSVQQMIDVENKEEVKATYYVRVFGSPYNPFDYNIFNCLKVAESQGHEIGLHTNPVEFAEINGIDPIDVVTAECNVLKSQFNITSLSTHRDLNYMYNSLPWLEENWKKIKSITRLECQAYESIIFENSVYVNEGLNPHICWRNHRPEDVIKSGESVYLLTHNHWWFDNHPFEIR